MRTRDGHNLPNDSRDLTFLVETGIRAPDVLIERSDVFAHQETLDEVGTDLYGSQAITFYSANQGKTSMHDTIFGRRGTEDNRRDAKFSTPIEFCTQSEKP